MATYKYLDSTGLGTVWGKIKNYVDTATSGIPTNLSGLTDTTISSPSDGQILRYDNSSSKWINSNETTYTFDGTYNASTNKAATVSTVTTAIGALTIPTGSSSTPQPLGTASAGSSSDFSKADHVHALPTLSISSNVITLTGASGQTTSITLPVYNGGVSSS